MKVLDGDEAARRMAIYTVNVIGRCLVPVRQWYLCSMVMPIYTVKTSERVGGVWVGGRRNIQKMQTALLGRVLRRGPVNKIIAPHGTGAPVVLSCRSPVQMSCEAARRMLIYTARYSERMA